MYKFSYKLDTNQLMPGAYRLDAALYDGDGHYVDLKTAAGKFVIKGTDSSRAGVIKLNGRVDL